MSASPRLAVIVPTYNEEVLLARCVETLREQEFRDMEIVVVNAGRPLPEPTASQVTEIRVPDDHFWTACIGDGLTYAKEKGHPYIMFANSDTEFMPGSVGRLIAHVEKDPMVIACCPAYVPNGDGSLETLYTRQGMLPFLWHNWNKHDWIRPEEAPQECLPSDTIGGQGTLFDARLIERVWADPVNFPQTKGDCDFWLKAQRAGYRLMVDPQTGVVNNRGFGDTGGLNRKQRFKKTWFLMTSPRARDSYVNLWKWRRVHMSLPGAVASFLVSVPVIWAWRFAKAVRYK